MNQTQHVSTASATLVGRSDLGNKGAKLMFCIDLLHSPF